MLRILIVVASTLALGACASIPNALDSQTRQSVFIKDASVGWSLDDSARAANENYVAGKTEVIGKLEAAVEDSFKQSPAGAEAALFEIDVTGYSRVGAAMGNLVGGSNMITADVKVVRISDGRELGVYKKVYGVYASNGGIIGAIAQGISKPDVEGLMANSFAATLRQRFDAKK